MDKFIACLTMRQDNDLMICEGAGVACQSCMKPSVKYGDDYYAKVEAYEGSEIAKAVNHGRVALMAKYVKPNAWVLDYGAGTGAFLRAAIQAGFYANGFDVMPQAVQRLRNACLWASDPSGFDAVALWDVLEHLEDPGEVLRQVRRGACLFVSIPVIGDLRKIRESKHYRPGEHLYYWTLDGFIEWAANYGFRLLEQSWHEVEAGRESIGAFAFCRDLEMRAAA